jgi:hypothetical protein
MDNLTFFLGFIILAGLFLYFSGRYYLREAFQSVMFLTPKPGDKTRVNLPDRPYTTRPINKLEDYNDGFQNDSYELDAVYNNEGSRVAGKREINDAFTRYPLSWTARPPSDQQFQEYREAFVDASEKEMTDAPAKAENIQELYKAVSGDEMVPPDTTAAELEEQKLLAMYNPDQPQPLKEYNINNTLERITNLVKRIYDKKGLLVDVERSKQGPNVFEIVETRPKDEKIVWEDEVARDPVERYKLRNEEQIEVPVTVSDVAAGLDPFYEPRTRTRMDRHDYTQWTPGLERQFAPTYAKDSWY